MTQPARSVEAKLRLDSNQYDRAAEGSARTTTKLGDAAEKAQERADKAWREIGDKAGLAGAAIAAAVGVTVFAASRFEQAMSQVDAATHASAAEMDTLSEAALQAGKDTAFSATEAAQGIEELAKAGVATTDIVGGGLSGALALAAAGQISVAEAAETAASAMTQFKLAGSDVTHIADLLAAGAGKAQGGVSDLSQALNQSGLVAAQVGLTLEETVGTLSAFASAGLLGSDAGTSFKTMLQRLIAPMGRGADLMKELGISAFDAQGKFIGMAALAGQLRDVLGGMTDEQRTASLAILFGTDAIRAASLVYEQGSEGIQDWIAATNDAGYAADTAARKTDNLMGDVERLTGELETLAIESGSGVNAVLRIFTQLAEDLVAQLAEVPPVISGTVVALGALTAASLLTFAGWVRLRGAVRDMLDELGKTGPRGAAAAGALGRVGRAAGRAAALLTGLMIAGQIADQFLALDVRTDSLTQSLEKFNATGEAGGELARLYGADLNKLGRDLEFVANMGGRAGLENGAMIEGLGLGIPVMKLFDRSAQSVAERMEALEAAMVQMAEEGGPQLESVMAFLDERAAELGVTTDELVKSHFPELAAALDVAREKSAGAEIDMHALGEQMGATGEDAAEAAEEIIEAWTTASNEFVDLVDIQNSALEDLAEGHDLTAEKILEGLRKQVEAQANWQQNMIDLAGRVPPAVLDHLARLGPEAAPLVQAMVNSSGEQMQEFIDLMSQSGAEGGAEFAQQLAEAGPILAAIADQLGWKTANKIRDGMARNGTTVQEEAARMGIRVVEAFSVSLSGMPDIRIHMDEGSLNRANRRISYAARDRTVRLSFDTVGFAPVGGINIPRRWGGAVEHARHGLLRDAAMFSAQAPARYAFAEPGTGGEAFIPRFGDRDRSLAVLEHAASWYGHTVTPGSGTQVGGRTPMSTSNTYVTNNVYPLKADFTVRDLEATLAVQEARQRVGRPR